MLTGQPLFPVLCLTAVTPTGLSHIARPLAAAFVQDHALPRPLRRTFSFSLPREGLRGTDTDITQIEMSCVPSAPTASLL